jgi:hypothetical protein
MLRFYTSSSLHRENFDRRQQGNALIHTRFVECIGDLALLLDSKSGPQY